MRRQLNKPDRYPRGEYLTAMNGKLDAYIREHCAVTDVSGWESRRHLTHEELVELHRKAKCSWSRYGTWVVEPVNGG